MTGIEASALTFHLLEMRESQMKKGSAMRQENQPLDRSILAAFKHAQNVGRLDVAEHLLCALECLCGDDAVEKSGAGDAYRVICCECGDERPETECESAKGRK